jgi:hypothetical protein
MESEAAAMDGRSDDIDTAPRRALVNQSTRPRGWTRFVWIGLAAASVVGCASHGPLASAKVAQAERAVDDAQQAGAGVSAPLELRTAQDKLRAAQTALAKGKNDRAIRSAEQAAIDGDYARAVAASQRANAMADEMGQYIKVLRQELERLPQ